MAIGGIGTTGYTVGYETRRMERNTAGKNFAEEIEKTVNVDNIAACNKTLNCREAVQYYQPFMSKQENL